jgi:transcriptional regulator with XRE-family HTH domain
LSADFATKIRALRKFRKTSQEKLGPILGITQSAVSQALRSKSISLSHAAALAKFFDVSLDYLADPSIPVRSQEELVRDKTIRDIILAIGPELAYHRLILNLRDNLTNRSDWSTIEP